MKLTKNDQLIILILFIIACLIFIGYTCQCKRENFVSDIVQDRIKKIRCHIRKTYNNGDVIPSTFNVHNQKFNNTYQKPIMINVTSTQNQNIITFHLNYLFVDKNCLYFAKIDINENSIGTVIRGFGNNDTLLEYIDDNFIFTDLQGNEITKINKNLFIKNDMIINDLKTQIEITNIFINTAKKYMPGIIFASNSGKKFITNLNNFISSLMPT